MQSPPLYRHCSQEHSVLIYSTSPCSFPPSLGLTRLSVLALFMSGRRESRVSSPRSRSSSRSRSPARKHSRARSRSRSSSPSRSHHRHRHRSRHSHHSDEKKTRRKERSPSLDEFGRSRHVVTQKAVPATAALDQEQMFVVIGSEY